MIEATCIALAFGLGLVARVIGLPPLIGYLGAGFALAAFDNQLGITRQDSEILAHLSHLGVLLLLFTVGLKLKLGNLARPEVVGGSVLHFALSSVLMLPPILLFLEVGWYEALMLSVVLAFSSTVLAAKVLESRRELKAFHGRVAIGVLIMQDLIALLVMSLTSGQVPSAWALLVFLLPLLRPLLFRLLDHSGHEELLVLLGLMLALVVGGLGFESVGLSSELGALAFGAMLAKHPRAGELSNSLWSVKEVFLIVMSVAMPQWLVPLAITLAFSFILSAQFNRVSASLYNRLASRLVRLERNTRHPDEQPVSLGDAQILVMGMGRSGRAAYHYLKEKGYRLISLDSDPVAVERGGRRGLQRPVCRRGRPDILAKPGNAPGRGGDPDHERRRGEGHRQSQAA